MSEDAPTGDIPEPQTQSTWHTNEIQNPVPAPAPNQNFLTSTQEEINVSPDTASDVSASQSTVPTTPNGTTEGGIGAVALDTQSSIPQATQNTVSDQPQPDEAATTSQAYAIQHFREIAAENRAIAKRQAETSDMLARHNDITGEKPSPLHFLKHADYQGKREGLRKEYRDFVDETARADRTADRAAQIHIPELQAAGRQAKETDHKPPYFSPEERAAAYDRFTDRIETWAGVLHDHPLSDEFQKANPGLQLQPETLVRMEDSAKILEQEIEEYEATTHPGSLGHEIYTVLENTDEGTAAANQMKQLKQLVIMASAEDIQEYHTLKEDMNSTATKLSELQRRLFDQQRIQPLRDQLAITRNMLNDVRRAVGLPVEGEETENTNKDQPDDAVAVAPAPDQPHEQ